MTFKRFFQYVYFSGLILVPVALIVLPADIFNSGPPLCLSVVLFDTECLGCGSLRAMQHIIHLDFKSAYEFNKLSFIVFPMLGYLWIKEAWRYKKLLFNKKNQ